MKALKKSFSRQKKNAGGEGWKSERINFQYPFGVLRGCEN
jgi:hypothetical protein